MRVLRHTVFFYFSLFLNEVQECWVEEFIYVRLRRSLGEGYLKAIPPGLLLMCSSTEEEGEKVKGGERGQ